MRPDPQAAFAVGLLAVLAFVGAAVAFAADPDLFSTRRVYVALFDSAGTLADGAAVTAHGLAVGRVARVAWNEAARRYRVELRMDRDWTPPPGGGLRVEEPNPLRGAVVAVAEATSCRDRAAGDDAVAGGRAVATCLRQPGMIETANALLVRASAVAEGAASLVSRLGEQSSEADGRSRSRLEDVADNAAALSGSVRALADKLGALQPEVQQTMQAARLLATDADAMVRRGDGIMDAMRRDTVQRLNRVLDTSETLMRSTAAPLQASLGDLRYMMGASSTSVVRLVGQLEALTANLAEITRQLRDDPAALLRGRSLENPPGTSARPR